MPCHATLPHCTATVVARLRLTRRYHGAAPLQAGLEAAHDLFQIVNSSGVSRSLGDEMRLDTTSNFHTGVVKGSGTRGNREVGA